MNSQPCEVLIVGAGPAGMTAALELSRQHIPLRIIEKTSQPATTSRAIGVQSRTLELFEQRGLIARMLSHGNRGLAGGIYGEGKRIFRLDFAAVRRIIKMCCFGWRISLQQTTGTS